MRQLPASEVVEERDTKTAPRYTVVHKMVSQRRNNFKEQQHEQKTCNCQSDDSEESESESEWYSDKEPETVVNTPRQSRSRKLPLSRSRSRSQISRATTKLVWRRESVKSQVPLMCLLGDSQVRAPLLPKCVASVEALRNLRVEQLSWIIESRGRAHSPPPLIMLHVGYNNLGTDSGQLLVARLVDLVRAARAAFPGSIVFLNGILRPPDAGAAFINQVNSMMRRECDRLKAVFIDTNKFVYKNHFAADRVHLNAEGRIALYKMISRVIDIALK